MNYVLGSSWIPSYVLATPYTAIHTNLPMILGPRSRDSPGGPRRMQTLAGGSRFSQKSKKLVADPKQCCAMICLYIRVYVYVYASVNADVYVYSYL